MYGVKGVVLIKEGEVLDADVQSNVETNLPSMSIHFLLEFIREKGMKVEKIFVKAPTEFLIYVHDPHVLCILASPKVNIHLLNVVSNQLLQDVEVRRKKEIHVPPPSPRGIRLEDRIPSFSSAFPKDKVLDGLDPVVDSYARNVLEFVDGTRTIKDMIAASHLPPEQVWDVILSHRSRSVLYFKE